MGSKTYCGPMSAVSSLKLIEDSAVEEKVSHQGTNLSKPRLVGDSCKITY